MSNTTTEFKQCHMAGCFRCAAGSVHGWRIEVKADPPVNTDRQRTPYGPPPPPAAATGRKPANVEPTASKKEQEVIWGSLFRKLSWSGYRSPYVEAEEEKTASKKEWVFQPLVEDASPEQSEVEGPEYDFGEAIWIEENLKG